MTKLRHDNPPKDKTQAPRRQAEKPYKHVTEAERTAKRGAKKQEDEARGAAIWRAELNAIFAEHERKMSRD